MSVNVATPPGARFNELWPWIAAVGAFDLGDPKPLAEMIKTEAVPVEIREVLASIVIGKRRTNHRSYANAKKIKGIERLYVGATVANVLEITDIIKRNSVEIGARNRIEPIEVRRDMEQRAREIYQTAAANFGCSVETIEDLVRDYKSRLKQFPDV